MESLVIWDAKMPVDLDNVLVPQSEVDSYSIQVGRLVGHGFPNISQKAITEGLVYGGEKRE